jgi:hypothetical protein
MSVFRHLSEQSSQRHKRNQRHLASLLCHQNNGLPHNSQHQKQQPQDLQVQPPEAWHSQPPVQQLVRFWVLHLQALVQSLAQWQVLARPL